MFLWYSALAYVHFVSVFISFHSFSPSMLSAMHSDLGYIFLFWEEPFWERESQRWWWKICTKNCSTLVCGRRKGNHITTWWLSVCFWAELKVLIILIILKGINSQGPEYLNDCLPPQELDLRDQWSPSPNSLRLEGEVSFSAQLITFSVLGPTLRIFPRDIRHAPTAIVWRKPLKIDGMTF